MYFSLNGRWHTRLLVLVGPFCLTWAMATASNDRDYWFLFFLMTVVGLVLDVGVYGWLIGYQPRWLTVGLGGIEFLLLKWITEWPYPFEIRLHTRQALVFYGIAWLMSWITMQAIIPWLRPRWAEEGGELRGFLPRFNLGRGPGTGRLGFRRRLYLVALGLTFLARLPWLTALFLAPAGRHFTGLLVAQHWHLSALTAATAGSGDTIWSGPETLIGAIARLGRWPVLDLYLLAAVVATCIWFLCILTTWPVQPVDRTRLGAAILIALIAPPMTLLVLVLAVWILVRVPVPVPTGAMVWQRLMWPVIILAVAVWGIAWTQVPPTSSAYVGEAQWQTLIWLQQSAPAEAAVAALSPLDRLIPALSGRQLTHMPGRADLFVVEGLACQANRPMFAHGEICILDTYQVPVTDVKN